MTSAASLAAPPEASPEALPEASDVDPLDHARACLQVFVILFGEFFEGAPVRYITRALHTRASAFLRGLEAVIRRILLIRAARLMPDLPPSRPSVPRSRPPGPSPVFDPADAKTWRTGFDVLRRCGEAVGHGGRAGAGEGDEAAYRLADLRPLAMRFEAIARVLADPQPASRRLAFALRAIHAQGGEPYFDGAPRLHPDHERYFARDLAIFGADANEALRVARENSS